MEIKLVKTLMLVEDYINSGHELNKGDIVTVDGANYFTVSAILSRTKICIDTGDDNFKVVDCNMLLIKVDAVLKQDINFKHIVQTEISFDNG